VSVTDRQTDGRSFYMKCRASLCRVVKNTSVYRFAWNADAV